MSLVQGYECLDDCPICAEARSRAAHPAGRDRDWTLLWLWVIAMAVVSLACLIVIVYEARQG